MPLPESFCNEQQSPLIKGNWQFAGPFNLLYITTYKIMLKYWAGEKGQG